MKKTFISTLFFSMLLGSAVAQQPQTANSIDKISYLFIQTAPEACLKENPNQDGTYKLKLTKASPYIKYFSVHPERVSGMLPIHTFFQEWAKSFTHDAPNAGVYGLHADKPISFSMELSDPHFDAVTQTVTYTASPLDKLLELTEHLHLKDVAIFIDDYCASCSGGGF